MITADNANEQRVLDFFEALSTGDLERVRPLFHPDATWTPMADSIPGAGVHRGRTGIVDEFLAPVRGLFVPGDPKVVIDSLVSKGPVVVAETRGIGKFTNGKDYNNRYCWVIELRDDMVFAIREYMDTHYVMTQVG